MKKIASPLKVAYHQKKLAAYLRNEPIFPVTLELDITSTCTRSCKDCPSSRSSFQQSLSFDFITNLFQSLEGQTRGLLLTGGEATMSPLFPDTLALARKTGFEDIAVVTNGMLLDKDRVAEALLEHASTIRLSLYDWDQGTCHGIEPSLRRIEALRNRIDRAGSGLQIGISVLTSRTLNQRIGEVSDAVRRAGAHWIYYHPKCTGWKDARLEPFDQAGVLDTIDHYRETTGNHFNVFVCPSRYDDSNLSFDGYHAAHFLMVIGADGKNYLGAEVKYQDRFVLADVAGQWQSDFVHQAERLRKIAAMNSAAYSALKSRHRGVLYNDYIEKLKRQPSPQAADGYHENGDEFLFPHIL